MRKKEKEEKGVNIWLANYRGKMVRFLVCKLKVRKDTESVVSGRQRKHDPDYFKFGFSSVRPDAAPLPQCVICHHVNSLVILKLSTKSSKHLTL